MLRCCLTLSLSKHAPKPLSLRGYVRFGTMAVPKQREVREVGI